MTQYYPTIDPNPNFPALEEEILQFWQRERVFEASVSQRPAVKEGTSNAYVFYDGPPFANGLPHYGHLLTGYVKDVVARYHTMKGKRVERRFGWDCHGLPAEMAAEKELGISGRVAITNFGIDNFNEHCRTSVMKYTQDWRYYVTRQGRWVDFDNDYKTMDVNFMESCLWAFSELYKKGLVYESFRVMPYSWAAETPVSNFETRIDNATREREDKAAYVKFKLKDKPAGAPEAENYYLIAWTTTPWTLPSNLALAVNKEMEYTFIINKNECIITEQKSARRLFKEDEETFIRLGAPVFDENGKLKDELSSADQKRVAAAHDNTVRFDRNFAGGDLIGLAYEPLFPYFAHAKNAFCVLDGSEFVTDGDGTGIVHMAPGFGEVDQKCCADNGIEVVVPVDEKGCYTSEIYDIPWFSSHRAAGKDGAASSSPHEGEQALPLQSRGGYEATLIRYARQMRKEPTPWENKLWQRLKSEQIGGFKFRRQQPIGAYIADFYNTDKQLIIEVDGSQHADNVADKKRDEALHGLGYEVVRIWNNEIDSNLDGVCEHILKRLKETPHRAASADAAPPQGGSEEAVLSLAGLNVIADRRLEESDKAIHIAEKDVEKYGLANMRIVRWLKAHGKLVKDEPIKHNYPHCWRTDTPLIYRAMSSWYVNVQAIKEQMLANNETIHWIPDHIQQGQMGKGIASAPDWSISRNRFWGTPIPIWRAPSGKLIVPGSIAEIEALSGKKVPDLHRPYIDAITFEKDGEIYTRVEDVFDCWFESGSMPYAQVHYPFENKQWFEENFPADFITEYVAQTRGWFYTLQVLSAALFAKAPFMNCICHGVVIDEETGLKYSKRLKNYKDPKEVMDAFGADALRWLMLASPVMRGADLAVDPEGKFIRDVVRLNIKPLWSALNFFTLYANADGVRACEIMHSANTLDRYILAKAKAAVLQVQASLDAYDTPGATEAITQFLDVVNNWYIRRSRPRFWAEAVSEDKQAAYDTLYTVLNLIAKAAAPLLPFTTEMVFQALQGDYSPHAGESNSVLPDFGGRQGNYSPPEGESNGASATFGGGKNNPLLPPTGSLSLADSPSGGELVLRSVHLCDFPDVAAIDDAAELVSDMDRVRDACNAIASIRSAENIRNRQPLARVTLYGAAADRLREYGELIADEANVKEVTFAPSIEGVAEFSLTIDFKVAGKRLGAKMKEVGAAAKSGAWMRADNGDVIVCAEALRHDEYRLSLKPLVARGAAPLSSNDALVVLDLTVTPALEAEGRARDVVRLIQQARKEANLNVSDRVHILLNIPRPVMQAVEQHAEYVSSQTLADSLTLGDVVASAHVFTQEVEGEAWSVGVSKAA